ncbi:unnamed protein product, partial [Urochloa humidicola]
ADAVPASCLSWRWPRLRRRPDPARDGARGGWREARLRRGGPARDGARGGSGGDFVRGSVAGEEQRRPELADLEEPGRGRRPELTDQAVRRRWSSDPPSRSRGSLSCLCGGET